MTRQSMRGLVLAMTLLAAPWALAGSAMSGSSTGVCAPAPGDESMNRFASLPRLYAEWTARDCYPPQLDDRALATAEPADRALLAINGRLAFVRNPPAQWTRHCDSSDGFIAEVLRTSGQDLVSLRRQLESSSDLAHRDLLEIGLGRARTRDGGTLYSVYLATMERAVRLQCYTSLDAIVEQAGTIFRRDEHEIAQLYDFLQVERGSERLSSNDTGVPTLRP